MRTRASYRAVRVGVAGGAIGNLNLWGKRAFGAFLLCAATAIALRAQTYTVLFSFDGPDGEFPYGALVQATNGNFYGTTFTGGTNDYCVNGRSNPGGCGTVFQITPSGTLSTLYNFCSQTGCADGDTPVGALTQATDGNFYGITNEGGANNSSICENFGCGTVFEITPSGTLTTLYSFCAQSNCTDGAGPTGGVVQGTDGNFYGTTTFGGANNAGTVFVITSSGALTTLYSFCSQSGCADGEYPNAGLVQATDGNFYGTTGGGYGSGTYGTVFKITSSGDLTTLHNFGGTDGDVPAAALVQATNGNFYGTTSEGGANGGGTVFEITPSGTLTTLYSFDILACPAAPLVQASDGNLYGTTSGSGLTAGEIFEITPGGTLTTLYNFCSQSLCTDGYTSEAALVQAANGLFYGTTAFGGANGYGTVFSLSVSLPAGPLLTSSPTGLSFGTQSVSSTSGPQTVTLTNTGTAPLSITSILASGDFAQTNTCGNSVAAEASCTISVTFTPTAPGTRTGAITITDNAPGSPREVLLTGTGTTGSTGPATPGAALSTESVSVGSQSVGSTSPAHTLTLTNTGSGTLTVASIAVSGDFAQTNTCGKAVAAGKSCTISVTFTPTASGARTGTITITDNAPGSPQIVSLTGTATGPALTLSAATLSVGGQVVGTNSAAHTVTLTNTGNAALILTSIAITPAAFTETNKCGTSLAAGASCTITVTFTPSVAGEITGMLTITDNAFGSPQQVSLSGVGQDFTLGPYNLTQTVNPGAGTSYLFKVGPLGGFNQAVSLTCSGVPQAATCTVSPASVVLDGRTHAVITLEVSTTAPTGTVRWRGRGRRLPPFRPLGGQWLWLGGLGLGILALMARRRRLVLASTLILLAGMLWASCGGGTASSIAVTPGTPAGTYTLTVNATSGGLSHNTTATLVVQ